jgi:NAD(P)-dependent dehydrogenase (short-subunit alcohol dehydrogenase family)
MGEQVLSGRAAVVTGGARGIGRAIVDRLAAAGAQVVVAARDRSAADAVAKEVGEAGGRAVGGVCDVADEVSVQQFAEHVRSEVGVADIVIANSGIAGPTAPLVDISFADWRECIGVDLDGVFLTFRAFLPPLIERGTGGSLIAISSVTGKRPLPNRTPYAAAKLGVVGLVRTLAHEVGPHGIRVNAISPGAVDGPRIRDVIAGQASALGISAEAAQARFVEASALRSMVSDGHVGDACVFLGSDAAASITGEDMNVSAGLHMY